MTAGPGENQKADAPIRVLYSFPHAVGAPGIGVTALNQIRGLRAAGALVTVVCTSIHETVQLPEAVRTLTVFGRRVPHRLLGSVETALAFHDRRAAAVLSRGNYDVVHTWPLGALATLRAARSRRVLGTREAPNSHTAVAYELAENESRRVGIVSGTRQSHHPNPKRLQRELLEYEAADLILVPSAHVEKSFLDQHTPAAKLARHQYGFDPNVFHAHDRADGSPHQFTAVFLGSAEPRKGLHYALEAWHASGAAERGRLLIAGAFAPGYREYLAHLLDHPSVHVLGFVSDTAALLRSADILVLPSVEEGSALVTFEALASGCIPLVSTSSGATFVAGREGLLHEPGDVRTLAGQIRSVQTDRGLRERLRAAGISAAESFTWDAAGVRMLQIYSDSMHRPRH